MSVIDDIKAGKGLKPFNSKTHYVETVFCKDCKHWIRHDKRCVRLNYGTKPDFYCGLGEEKHDS